eukprot:IDg193t1
MIGPLSDYKPTTDDEDDVQSSTESTPEMPLEPQVTSNHSLTIPRRSTRTKRKPTEWTKTSALLTNTPESILSYTAATTGEDSDKWLPAIQSEVDSIRK